MVKAGWSEWRKSGRIPNPEELAALPVEWLADIYTLNAMVEAGRPDEKEKDKPRTS